MKDLDHSNILDVHRWSDHPEVNRVVDWIYSCGFEGREDISKKHIKVVLLSLYMDWKTNPTLVTAVERNRNRYYGKSRYNELHISHKTIQVVDRLVETGFIEMAPGFYDRREGGKSRVSRIWPTLKLQKVFENANIPDESITENKDREVIILKDCNKNLIQYEDSQITNTMRGEVKAFNRLIQNCSIDHWSKPCFPKTTSYRIFNNGSFDLGGRLYGGWWQGVWSDFRKDITINGQPTVELDYSSLHPAILYAEKGIQLDFDPYAVEGYDRTIAKALLLIAINCSSPKEAFRALRGKANRDISKHQGRENELLEVLDGSSQESLLPIYQKNHLSLEFARAISQATDAELSVILDALNQHNEPIAASICAGEGLRLQRIDSEICMAVVNRFVAEGRPILPIHDSFVVQKRHETFLCQTMAEAAFKVAGIRGVRITS